MSNTTTVGASIRDKRIKLNLTQADLAVAMGFDAKYQSYVSKVESGEINPSLETLVKFAKALGCQVSDIQPLIG